jgi:hypothetical protein
MLLLQSPDPPLLPHWKFGHYPQFSVTTLRLAKIYVDFRMSPPGHEKHVSEPRDEVDEWELRIERGGCAKEHERLQECYLDGKDWRGCREEVRAVWARGTNVDGGV